MVDYRADRAAAQESLLGPLRTYLCYAGVTELAINKPGEIQVKTGDGWQRYVAPGLDFCSLSDIAVHLANPCGQSISHLSPIVSGALHSGERVQLIYPPAVPDGTVSITIRKPNETIWTLDDLCQMGMLDWGESVALRGYVGERRTVVVSGATGSGKTTLMRAMALSVPTTERLVTIEDVAELRLPHPNVVPLFYALGKKGIARDVTANELLVSSLRMCPDRILLAELRGDEAYPWLRSINSGHPGSITSLHANSCALAREQLLNMVGESEQGRALGAANALRMIDLLVDVWVHVAVVDGVRRVTEIKERSET